MKISVLRLGSSPARKIRNKTSKSSKLLAQSIDENQEKPETPYSIDQRTYLEYDEEQE